MSNEYDERTSATMQNWLAAAGWFLSIALCIDVIVRSVILKQAFGQWWDIGLIWILSTVLVSIGMTREGVPPLGETKWSWKTHGWLVLIIALVVPLMGLMDGDVRSISDFAEGVAIAGTGALMGLGLLRFLYGRWERRTLGRGSEEE